MDTVAPGTAFRQPCIKTLMPHLARIDSTSLSDCEYPQTPTWGKSCIDS